MWTESEIRHDAGPPLAVGRAEWVYVDRQRHLPSVLDPALMARWLRATASPLWQPAVAFSPPAAEPTPVHWSHEVAFYEATEIRHTNNTYYAQWFEEAPWRALRGWSYPVDLAQGAILPPAIRLHTITTRFQRSTYLDDEVTTTTHLVGVAPDACQVSLHHDLHGPTPISWSKPRLSIVSRRTERQGTVLQVRLALAAGHMLSTLVAQPEPFDLDRFFPPCVVLGPLTLSG